VIHQEPDLNFPPGYWEGKASLDGEFLDELQVLGARAPVTMTDLLLQAYGTAGDDDQRRIIAARALGEMAQGVETFAILAMAVRDRHQRGILETFVLHDVGAPKQAIDSLAGLERPKQIDAFLNVRPDALDEDQRRALPTIFQRGQGLARILTMKGGVVRTFHNKSKHGPVLVRSVREGQPRFGATEPPTIFVITRNPGGGDENFWNSVGVPASEEFLAVTREGCGYASEGISLLLSWIRRGLANRNI
jgi:hypothetical protein